MRKFLKQLRKGLRTACVTAALATCWNVGQSVAHAGYSYGEELTVQFTGTVSPTETDLSHVYLIYGTGNSSINSDIRVLELGDYTVNGPGSFSIQGIAEYDAEFFWFVAGLYGDLNSGNYTEGVNGVTLSASYNPSFGRTDWDDFIYNHLSESDMFGYLLNNDTENLSQISCRFHSPYAYMELNDSSPLYNFSAPTANGTIEIQSQIVPEPMTILLLGPGGIIVLRRKRPKE